MSKTATPPDAPARTGGSLTTNPIQKAVNGCMKALGTLTRQEHREAAHRILGELLASERPAVQGRGLTTIDERQAMGAVQS